MRSDELLAKKLDGALSPAEAAELQSLLSADPELARELAELEQLESALDFTKELHSPSARIFREEHKAALQGALMQGSGRRWGGIYWLGGAVLILSSLALWYGLNTGDVPNVNAESVPVSNSIDAPEESMVASMDEQTPSAELAGQQSDDSESVQDSEASGRIPVDAGLTAETRGLADVKPSQSSGTEQIASPDEAPQSSSEKDSDAKARSTSGAQQSLNDSGRVYATIESTSSEESVRHVLQKLIQDLNSQILSEKSDVRRAALLQARAKAEQRAGLNDAAENSLLEALKLIKSSDMPAEECKVLGSLALIAHESGRSEAASDYKRRALQLSATHDLAAVRDRLAAIPD